MASSLPYLPLAGGLIFRVKDTWPRTNRDLLLPGVHRRVAVDAGLLERVELRSASVAVPGSTSWPIAGVSHRSQIV